MKFLTHILLLLSFLTASAFGSWIQEDKLRIGKPTGSADKIFQVGPGCVRYKNSSSKLEFAHDCSVYTELGTLAGADSPNDLQNYSIAASVAANALTIALKSKAGTNASVTDSVSFGFRSSTASSGTYVKRQVTGALSLVVSSGSTLGTVSGQLQTLYVYAIDNAGTVELAISGSRIWDETQLQNTTAEGGAGAADSVNVLYSTTARTGVAVRYIGIVQANEATAGTWATAPSLIAVGGDGSVLFRDEIEIYGFTGTMGSTNTKVLRYTNSITTWAATLTSVDSATLGGYILIPSDGNYAGELCVSDSGNTSLNYAALADTPDGTVDSYTLSPSAVLTYSNNYAATVASCNCSPFHGFFKKGQKIQTQGESGLSGSTRLKNNRLKVWKVAS
jgi:hypothetical protein